MKLAGISVRDIVEVNLRGRILLGRVTDVGDGVVYFQPVWLGAGWRHAKAREITAHWRKTGRRAGAREEGGGKVDETDTPAPMDGQLSIDEVGQ
jgi:hypothetical protein